MKTKPQYLTAWSRPSNYFGAEWHGYYSAGVGQSRDSDALERANFKAMLTALEALPDFEAPEGETSRIVVSENHWAVGWIEWIAIHETDDAAILLADSILEGLQNYPVIDEELFSEIEGDDCAETWANCYDPRERAQYLRKHLSSDWGIKGHFRELRAAVEGCWHSASNLLPCPSDILY